MESLASRAAAFARDAHTGQVDKAGRPYIGHPARVAARVAQAMDSGHPLYEEAIAAAWLHDVVEDTAVRIREIDALFGRDVATLVDALTRRATEEPAAYYARIRAAGEVAVGIKAADVADNTNPDRLAVLPPEVAARLTRKYARALAALGT